MSKTKLLRKLVKEQLPSLQEKQILLEPARRNTAPCIAMASMHIYAINPEANMVVAPCDHLILKEGEFIEAINKGLEFVAQSPQLLTLGIKPNRPETGYGYIQIAEEQGENFYEVKTFVEKPQLEFAEIFVASDEFYWNSGIFLWNVNTILNAFDTLMPEVCPKIQADDFASCPSISIDYAIMEKADEIFVFPANFGWSDLGTWTSLHSHLGQDLNGNVLIGEDISIYDSHNCIVHTENCKKVILIGLNDCVVSEQDGNLLVCKLNEEERIKELTSKLTCKYALYTQITDDGLQITDKTQLSLLIDYDVLVINTIGLLSSVYQYGQVAYIGGGFGVGIHNTLEAAAWGMPVVFGPNYHKFQEAKELIECGAGQSIKNYEECARALDEFFEKNEVASKAAAEYVASHTGATEIIYNSQFTIHKYHKY